MPIKACVCVHVCLYANVSVEFIGFLIKLLRAVSVGRPQTECTVNRLLIERERLKGCRRGQWRYEKEGEGGDERGIVMSAEPHFKLTRE